MTFHIFFYFSNATKKSLLVVLCVRGFFSLSPVFERYQHFVCWFCHCHSSHAITADVGIVDTAQAAKFFLADGVVVTGPSTGQVASTKEVKGQWLEGTMAHPFRAHLKKRVYDASMECLYLICPFRFMFVFIVYFACSIPFLCVCLLCNLSIPFHVHIEYLISFISCFHLLLNMFVYIA